MSGTTGRIVPRLDMNTNLFQLGERGKPKTVRTFKFERGQVYVLKFKPIPHFLFIGEATDFERAVGIAERNLKEVR